MTLATYPSYMRRGTRAALYDQGIKKAISNKLTTVTLFSSPIGIPLYKKLGFRQVVIVYTQVNSEEECINFPDIILEPKKIREE